MDSFHHGSEQVLGSHGYGTYAEPGGSRGKSTWTIYQASPRGQWQHIAPILYRLGAIAQGQNLESSSSSARTPASRPADSNRPVARPPKRGRGVVALNASGGEYLDHLRGRRTPDSALNKNRQQAWPLRTHATFFWSRYLSLNQAGLRRATGPSGVRDTNHGLDGRPAVHAGQGAGDDRESSSPSSASTVLHAPVPILSP